MLALSKVMVYIAAMSMSLSAMALLAIASIAIGIFYLPIITQVFGFEATQVNLFDIRSWLDYILYVSIGLVLYRFVIKKDFKFLQKIRNFSMSFEDANYALILFMSVFISVMFFMI